MTFLSCSSCGKDLSRYEIYAGCHICNESLKVIAKAYTPPPVKEIYPLTKEKDWMDSEAYCWYCDKNIRCECMDATCWVCHRPYAKERCKEFGFDENGNQVNKP